MKRYVAALLAMLMIVSMSVSVFAADDWDPITDDPSITIVNTSKNHTYSAYQIFTGELARKQREVPDPNFVGGSPALYPEYSIKTNNGEVHVYKNGSKYYYVSNGAEYTESTVTASPVYEQALRKIKWGNGVTDAGVVALYHKYVDATKDPSDLDTVKHDLRNDKGAEAVAQALRGKEESGAVELANFIASNGYLGTVAATANGNGGTAKLDLSKQGYYMITEAAANNTEVPDNVNEVIAYSRYIVRVGGTVVIEPKSDAPKIIKKVYDNRALSGLSGDMSNEDAMVPGFDLDGGSTNAHNLTAGAYPAHPDGANGGWNDVADYSIGDSIPFKIIGTLPNTYTGYNNYKYIIHDTLEPGFSIIPSTIHMYVMNGDTQTKISLAPAETGGNVTWAEQINAETKATTLTVSVGNMKLIDESGVSKVDPPTDQLVKENSKIVVEYAATLNYRANVGTAGNEGGVYLEFSNNPNPSDVTTTSKTSRDEVVVYTYMVEGVKIAAQQQSHTNLTLAGAEFKLRRDDGKWYHLSETLDANDNKVVTWVDNEEDASSVKTNGSGLFEYKGLDDGTYHLKEIVAPFGYILPTEEFKFEIHSDIDNSQSYNGTPASVWANGKKVTAITEGAYQSQFSATVDSNQKVVLTVTNSEQSQLPITGGVGVYVIYAAGIMLIVGASVLLFVKKRKASK